MPSRSLDDLDPELKEVCMEFVEQCAEHKINILVYCTYRSNEEQDKEYAKGRTISSGIRVTKSRPFGATVTDLKGGQSKHNVTINGKPAARAFDCVPTQGGIAQWNNLAAYEIMGEIGRGLNLEWGGEWLKKDRPHFQLKD